MFNQSKSYLVLSDFEQILTKKTRKGDFIYLDPPYHPTSPTSNFTSYTHKGFGKRDQRRLAEVFKKLDKRGCNILLSNSDTLFVRKLYKDYASYTVEIQANRAINSKASKRSGHQELLIRNYE